MMVGRPRAANDLPKGRTYERAVGLVLGCALASGLLALAVPQPAAARHHHRASNYARAADSSLTFADKDAAVIIDGETGKVIYARDADAMRYPASLTKMMTLYLLFDAMQKGRVTLETPLTVSAHSASQAPVKLYMRSGDTISVQQAIKAIVVRSANDVAVTIAENLGDSEGHFADLMTAKAHALGMTHTHFANASGLPDRDNYSSAGDLALLARHLAYDFPQYFHYFSTPSFTFRGHTWETHDNLIGKYDGADGIKTGYTVMSGFNLASSVVRDGTHVIGVVMGGRTARRRDAEMVRLLNDTFARAQQQPTLLARAEVPWLALAAGKKPSPVIAGFDIAPVQTEAGSRAKTVIAAAAPQLRPADATDPNNEDVAESRNDAQDANLIGALIAPKPVPRPPVALASYRPPAPMLSHVAPLPRAMTSTGNGVAAPSTMASVGLQAWTIQIGAYADPGAARTQLAAYAEKSMDILGQAARIVVPFQSEDGHTLYRARFGPFVEREARAVCARLTERGQTCFAAVAAR